MTSEDERDTADGARPSTRGSAKRVKTAGGTKSKRCSNMSSKAKGDAANVASARPNTSGSARGVKTAGGTKRKQSSNMASEAERVAANDSGPSTSGSAMSVRTPGGTELDFNDPWTARILVTTIAGVGMYLAQGFVTFLHNNPELVKYAVKVVFRLYGEVKDIKLNSITVDLACGSKKKFLKFKKDFEDGKVKVALEEELKEIGCDAKLELKLVKETPNVVAVEVSKKTLIEETRKVLVANLNREDVSRGEGKEEKESDQEAASGSTEIKREKESGPAAKTCKPGTSGVSSTPKTLNYKGRAEEMQQESQGKRPSARKRAAVKQKEKSGSATKKPKLDPTSEPGTSGVSSTSKKRKFKVKDGEPDDKELSNLAEEVTLQRGKLGHELNVPQRYLEQISVNHMGDAYEMAFQVLLSWRKNSSATSRYQELFDALIKIGCRDLAEKYCCY